MAIVDPRTFAIRKLQAADGAPFKAYWLGSGARTRDGDLLFGGLDGLTVVRPDRIARWSYNAPLAITELRAGGMTVAGAGRFNGSASAPRLTIAANANSLAVEFAALDLSAPQYNRYAYRLDGYDTHWIDYAAVRRPALHLANMRELRNTKRSSLQNCARKRIDCDRDRNDGIAA